MYSVILMILAVIAGVLGFTDIAGGATWITRTLFVVFLTLLIVSLLSRGKPQ